MRFIDCALDYLNKCSDELAPLTVRTYYWNLKKIEHFCPELECESMTAETVRNFKRHLETLQNKDATVVKALSVLRIFCNKMKTDGVIKNDPFDGVKIRRAYSRRGFLTLRELKQLYLNFTDRRTVLTPSEEDVMRVFLFSCFTGLRYADLRSLDSSEIFDWKIRKQMHKTDDAVYIPIPVQARLLLPEPLKPGARVSCDGKCVVQSHASKGRAKVRGVQVFALSSGPPHVCDNMHYHRHPAPRDKQTLGPPQFGHDAHLCEIRRYVFG